VTRFYYKLTNYFIWVGAVDLQKTWGFSHPSLLTRVSPSYKWGHIIGIHAINPLKPSHATTDCESVSQSVCLSVLVLSPSRDSWPDFSLPKCLRSLLSSGALSDEKSRLSCMRSLRPCQSSTVLTNLHMYNINRTYTCCGKSTYNINKASATPGFAQQIMPWLMLAWAETAA
jgi:hypothetical protein